MKRLQNKVIIVTGASKGLGVAMAEQCAAEGAKVVLAARSITLLQNLANRITASGGEALPVAADLGSLDSIKALVSATLEGFGRIDGLINNAGINFVKPFLEVELEEWRRVLAVDLEGSFFLTQLCAREMVNAGNGGSIVQIASVHTHASLAGAAPYDAAKHGMVGFSKAAAVELASDRVRINVLSPGLCKTEIWNDIVAAAPSEKACGDYWNANIPGQRLILPEEIARTCVFLLSDEASAITGANLFADLGMTSLLVSREPYASKPITDNSP